MDRRCNLPIRFSRWKPCFAPAFHVVVNEVQIEILLKYPCAKSEEKCRSNNLIEECRCQHAAEYDNRQRFQNLFLGLSDTKQEPKRAEKAKGSSHHYRGRSLPAAAKVFCSQKDPPSNSTMWMIPSETRHLLSAHYFVRISFPCLVRLSRYNSPLLSIQISSPQTTNSSNRTIFGNLRGVFAAENGPEFSRPGE